MLAAVVHDLLAGLVAGLVVGLEHDEGLDLLHLVGILHADDAAHVHALVLVQDALDLGGIDVVAAGDDHALDALAEVDVAVLVHHAQVAGVHPGEAVGVLAQGVRGLLGMVDVLHHHRGARQADLALLTVGHLDLGAGHHDLVVGIREGDADGALAGQARRGQAAGGDAFGGAVALAHLDGGLVILQEGVDALLQLHRQGIAAGEHALQAGEVQIVQAVQTQERLVQRGYACNEVRLVLAQQLRIGLGREARHQHAAAAVDQHGVDAHAQAEAVEHGHDGEHLVAHREDGVGGDDLRAQGVEVEVGE